MPKLIELLIFEHRNEHRNKNKLPIRKPFSAPKIYTANNNLKKRWFVYYQFRNPKTGLLERMGNIYGNANRYKTKEERLSILTSLQNELHILLKEGYNPFNNNEDLYNKEIEKTSKPVENEKSKMTVKEAIEFALNLKKTTSLILKKKEVVKIAIKKNWNYLFQFQVLKF